MRLRYGGLFNDDHFIANFLLSVPVKFGVSEIAEGDHHAGLSFVALSSFIQW